MTTSNFIIFLGGPGKFVGCDKAHDQTWTNYLVPIQIAATKDLYSKGSSEQIHLLAYEPAYKNRWADDSEITTSEQAQSDGYWLHSNRKAKADAVITKGASNYLHRIQQIAVSNGMTYFGITKPEDFWTFVGTLPDASISRVWYSGHAAGNGLMLSLNHNVTTCAAQANLSDMVLVSQIFTNRSLATKFSSTFNKVSKFYGCYTAEFAKAWNTYFKVKTEGAVNKIDFGVVDRQSAIVNVLERIEKTPTSVGVTGWTKYHTIIP